MFAEGLVTGRVVATFETFLAFVNGLMPPESSSSEEALSTAFFGADIVPLFGMRTFDMLFEMFLFYIGLIAVGIGALEGSVIVVGSQVRNQTSWTVETLVASWMGAFDRFQFGRKLALRRGHGS